MNVLRTLQPSQVPDLAAIATERPPVRLGTCVAPECAVTSIPAAQISHRPRVLIVDDDDVTLHALGRWLGYEYDIVEAHDGIEALESASITTPDVIITDVGMPRLDGIEMVRRMKKDNTLKHVPVIFLTANTTTESTVAGISAGARAYLAKPVDLDALDRKVRSALGRSSMAPHSGHG
jgi:DNA-binding response OmpR family regulator